MEVANAANLLEKRDLVLSNVPGALDEFEDTDYLTPDLMYGPCLLDRSGVVLLASKDLVVDMTERMLEGQVSEKADWMNSARRGSMK